MLRHYGGYTLRVTLRLPGRAYLLHHEKEADYYLNHTQLFHQRQVIFNMPVGHYFTVADLIDIRRDKIHGLTLPFILPNVPLK